MSNAKMFQMVWTKYMPLINLGVKAAIRKNEAQELKLDKYDFEKAGLVKNASFPFSVEFKEGHALYNAKISAIARDFTNSLLQDEQIKTLIRNGHFKFNMGSKLVLTVQKIGGQPAPAAVAETPAAATETPAANTETPVESETEIGGESETA